MAADAWEQAEWERYQLHEPSVVYSLPFPRETQEEALLQIRLLAEALTDLPAEERRCLQHFYYDQWTYQQIADQYQQTTNWVKSQLQNGKRRLRQLIAQRLDEIEEH